MTTLTYDNATYFRGFEVILVPGHGYVTVTSQPSGQAGDPRGSKWGQGGLTSDHSKTISRRDIVPVGSPWGTWVMEGWGQGS